MRITFVLPDAGMGGGVRAIATYAHMLQSRGHSVVCVSTPRKPVPMRRKLRQLAQGGNPFRAQPMPASHLDAASGVAHVVLDEYRAVEAKDVPDADVVIATWWETAEWVDRLPPAKGAKIYFVQHHEVVFDNQPVRRVEATYRLKMQKIVCAPWLAEVMDGEYNDKTAIYVPYGLDHALFDAPPRGKQNKPAIGMMYATAHFKACDVAIAAFELAARNVPNLRFRCFGQKSPTADLPLPTGTDFELLPTQQRIAEIYASCDMWMMPSRCEGFGMPVLEAMGCRTPVIGTPTGIMPELIQGGGGMLVKPDDAGDLAIAIERLSRLKDADWRKMSDTAYATAARFTWENSVTRFEAALAKKH